MCVCMCVCVCVYVIYVFVSLLLCMCVCVCGAFEYSFACKYAPIDFVECLHSLWRSLSLSLSPSLLSFSCLSCHSISLFLSPAQTYIKSQTHQLTSSTEVYGAHFSHHVIHAHTHAHTNTPLYFTESVRFVRRNQLFFFFRFAYDGMYVCVCVIIINNLGVIIKHVCNGSRIKNILINAKIIIYVRTGRICSK